MAERRGPRPATVAVGVAVLLGVVLLFWAADRAARWGAETLLARTVQSATGVPARPVVEVRGGWVLLQALRGRYDDVRVTVPGLSSGPLRLERTEAELTGVHLSFHDVLVQRPGQAVVVDHAVSRASLTFPDLDHYLRATGRQLTVEPGPSGSVRLTGTVQVLDQVVTGSARVRPSPEPGALAIRPAEVATATATDGTARLLLRQRFTVLVPLDPLPFGRNLREVSAGGQGLALATDTDDVVLRP